MLSLLRKRRLPHAWGVAILTIVLLAACVPVTSTPGDATAAPTIPATRSPGLSQGATAAPDATTPTVRLTLWHAYGGALGQSFEALVQEFNQTHPTIQIEPSYGGTLFTMREKLVAAIAGQAGPDLAQIDQFWSSELADAGALLALDSFIANDASLDRSDIWDTAWQTVAYRDQVWAMPFSLSNIALYYNKALFQQVGLDPEQPPLTWQMLADAARQLTLDADKDGVAEQWGLTVPLKVNEGNVYYWLAFLWQNDGTLFDENFQQVRFAEPAGVEALQFWVDLAKKDGALALSPPENGFEKGKIGMAIASTARLGALRTALGADNLGMAPLPAHRQAATGVGGASLAILSGARDQAAAWEFIRWMTSAEINLRWSTASGYLPLRQTVIASQTYQDYLRQVPQAQVILDQMPIAVVRPNIPAYTPISRELGLAIEAALFTEVSPQAALEAAAVKAAAALRLR